MKDLNQPRYPTVKFFQHYGHFADYKSVERRREFWLFSLFVALFILATLGLIFLLKTVLLSYNPDYDSLPLTTEFYSTILALVSNFIIATGFIQVLEYMEVIRRGTAKSLLPLVLISMVVLVLGLIYVAGKSASSIVLPSAIFVCFFSLAALIAAEVRRYKSVATPAFVFFVLFALRIAFLASFFIDFSISKVALYALYAAGGFSLLSNIVILLRKTKLENNPLLPEVIKEDFGTHSKNVSAKKIVREKRAMKKKNKKR